MMKLDPNCLSLNIYRPAKSSRPKIVIDVSKIVECREGLLTRELLLHREKLGLEEGNAFSIVVLDNSSKPLVYDFYLTNQLMREWWTHSLQTLVRAMSDWGGEAFVYQRVFLSNLRAGKSTVSVKTVLIILKSLNMPITKEALVPLMKRFDVDGDGRLAFQEFISLMRYMRTYGPLTYMFHNHQQDDKIGVTQLVEFFQIEQKEKLSNEEAMILIQKYSEGKAFLDDLGFNMLLTAAENNVMNPARQRIHHDLSKPLHMYHINSSHNTYLSGDQLKSESSIEMYVRAFTQGCRCVEVDVWDGPNLEPICYHGRTLTSKILFVDVLRVIRSHGFVASPYPVILSFETHCCREGQDNMAKYIEEILGDLVKRPSPADAKLTELPSPEALRHKVLIKATSLVSTGVNTEELFEEQVEMEGSVSLSASMDPTVMEAVAGPPAPTALKRREQSAVSLPPRADSEPSMQKKAMSRQEKQLAKKEEKLSARLSDLVFLKATKLKKFQQIEEWKPFQMTSFSETRIGKILSKGDEGFQLMSDYNNRFLSRVYPKATRFDSSNFDPILPWYAGCQMVALNYQTCDYPMWINYARFEENGQCGYNMRRFDFIASNTFGGVAAVGPKLRKASTPPDAIVQERFSRPIPRFRTLILEVFGGRMFPPSSSPIFFLVQLFDGEGEAFRFKSEPTSNCFAPDVSFENRISVSDTSNSYLAISVWSGNAHVAHWCGGLDMLRQGYRVCEVSLVKYTCFSPLGIISQFVYPDA